jgi:putative peptidoglycan lipid II flippase
MNTIILILILRKRLGLLGGRKIAKSLARAIVACAVMAGIVYYLEWYMRNVNNLVVLGVCVPVGAIVFVAVLWLMKAPELGELRGKSEN